MFVVALTRLATSLEDEATALAHDLGTTAYEERVVLNGGLPSLVLESAERAPAERLLARLRERGHGALLVDASEVVPADHMTLVRRFALEPDAIVLLDGPGARLPYSDIAAMVRARHRTDTTTESHTKSRQLSMGRALLSGGLVMTKNVTRSERTSSSSDEQVLYLFRATGAEPWLVRERSAAYAALGAELVPSSAQNFLVLTQRLRKLAPGASYDEQLLTLRRVPTRVVRTGTTQSQKASTSSASGMDLLAHIVASSLRPPPPYR